MNSARGCSSWWMVCALASSAQASPVEMPPASWLAEAQQALVQREYSVSETALGLQAPNRAQGFRTQFDAQGVTLVKRDAESARLLGVHLLEYGRKQGGQVPGAAELVAEGAKVTLRWRDIEARYENRSDGLVQQLALEGRPHGEGALRLVFALDGSAARLERDAVTLTGNGLDVRWNRFASRDADGRTIPLTLSVQADHLTLTLDDRHARYPIAIESILGGVADGQVESDQAGAYLGAGVAGAGDVNGDGFDDIIVGALNYDNGQADEGAAFIYFGGAGPLDPSPDAHLEMNQAMALFGTDVAGAGDVDGDGFDDVIVGAPSYDGGQPFEGAAFIYFGGPGAFDLVPDAHLEANRTNSQFGFSVAGAGDVNGDGFDDVVVGARSYSNGQSAEGAAYVYFGGAGAFDLAADAQFESDQTTAQMGVSVAGAGDVNGDGVDDIIIGAFRYANGEFNEGAAFLYFGGPGAFDVIADAQLESNQEGAVAGVSVAGAGDVNGDGFDDVIVGVPGYDNGEDAEGGAFVYFGGPGTFDLTADAQLESNQASSQFGLSVAGAGDVNGDGIGDVIVGARLYANGEVDEGAAFVYFGTATGPADLIFSNGFE
jgi:hypothetical protein